MKYKAAVIGLGRIGFEFDEDPKRDYISTHVGAYRSVRGVELVTVCDIDEKKINRCLVKTGLKNGYVDFKTMLKKEKIDILSICTPPYTHYNILKEAIKFPIKAIFCEKPLAESRREAKEMVNICKSKKIILQVDHQRRFDPLHVSLRNFIKSKKAGSVQQINFYYTAGIKNTGSHMFDLLRFFFGEVAWVEAFYSLNSLKKYNDFNLDGLVKFQNGELATFQALDVNNYLVFEMNCFFEKGRVVLKNSGFEVDFYRVSESKYFSGYRELESTKIPFNIYYKRNFLVNAIRHLIQCIRLNKDSISSGEDGLKAVELIEASIESANNNGKRIYIT